MPQPQPQPTIDYEKLEALSAGVGADALAGRSPDAAEALATTWRQLLDEGIVRDASGDPLTGVTVGVDDAGDVVLSAGPDSRRALPTQADVTASLVLAGRAQWLVNGLLALHDGDLDEPIRKWPRGQSSDTGIPGEVLE